MTRLGRFVESTKFSDIINKIFGLIKFIDINSPESNAWISNGSSLLIKNHYKTIQEKCIRLKDADVNKEYILASGNGSFYNDRGKSVGYFTNFTTVIKLLETPTDDSGKVEISGSTFKVTGDGSFANQSSTWVTPKVSTFAEANKHGLTSLIIEPKFFLDIIEDNAIIVDSIEKVKKVLLGNKDYTFNYVFDKESRSGSARFMVKSIDNEKVVLFSNHLIPRVNTQEVTIEEFTKLLPIVIIK